MADTNNTSTAFETIEGFTTPLGMDAHRIVSDFPVLLTLDGWAMFHRGARVLFPTRQAAEAHRVGLAGNLGPAVAAYVAGAEGC